MKQATILPLAAATTLHTWVGSRQKSQKHKAALHRKGQHCIVDWNFVQNGARCESELYL
jgi:hypothetical protein